MTRRLACIVSALLAASCAALASPAPAQDAPTQVAALAPPSPHGAATPADDRLYLALGGHDGMARIVDDFVPRLMHDPRTEPFFGKYNAAHLEKLITAHFCMVAGGDCVYTGADMESAHRDMSITKGDFNTVVEVLQTSMEAQGVPFSTQNQLLARLAPMHREIITVH